MRIRGFSTPALPVVQRLPYPEWGASGIQYLMADGTGNYNAFSAQVTQRFGSEPEQPCSPIPGPRPWTTPATSAARWEATSRPRMRSAPPRANTAPRISTFRIVSSASILYILPFGKGQHFLNHGGVVNQVVGGWQISTITTLQSGGVVNTSSWDSGGTNFISNATRLNCNPGVNPVLPNNNQNGWYNPAAFSNPVAGTFGNCGRNTLQGTVAGERRCFDREVFPDRRKKELWSSARKCSTLPTMWN